MSNKKRGAVSFEALGGSHALAFTMNAMCKYQDRAGETLIEGVDALNTKSTDVFRMRRLFWAGLKGDYTEETAGDLMDDLGLQEAVSLMMEAVTASFPDDAAAGGAGASAQGKPKAAPPPKG
jgi:hypothetical protein